MTPSRFMCHRLLGLSLCALWLSAAGCGGSDTPGPTGAPERLPGLPTEGDPELAQHLKDTFGIRLIGSNVDPNFYVDEDGDGIFTAEFAIDVEGLGARDLLVEEVVFSAAAGGGVCLYIEDIETGASRYFDFNTTDNYILFSQDLRAPDDPEFVERGAAVGRNPDGTYTVWTFDDEVDGGREDETTVATGYDALRLMEEYTDFNSIDPHIMLAAVAIGHTPVPEARVPVNCDSGSLALRPSVCSLFKEFCDCAACATLDRDGDCHLCPEL